MTDKATILIVDDEAAFQRICSKWLKEQGHNVFSAADPEETSKLLKLHKFDLILLDLALPPSFEPEEGLRLLDICPAVPVIVLTGHGNRELSLHAIEQGAWDFITKPVDPDMLKIVVERALQKQRLSEEVMSLRLQVSYENLGIIGTSKPTKELLHLIRRIAPSDINVMILGPSGTGKELVAGAIHKLSSRNSKPFVPLHCGAIPAELLESELFGHMKGSFTGADKDKPGILDAANGGTLFMDEIGEMPHNMQVKLLRFLQEGTFTPVGGREVRRADLRIITATHCDLEEMVKKGSFREDLYYRLKGMIVRTPSLKERIDDIPILANSFLQRFSPGKIKRFTAQTMDWLLKQPWKGNVRELENLIECTIALSGERPDITLEDVQTAMYGTPVKEAFTTGQSLDEQVSTLEKRLIIASLEETGHNHSQVAKRLGISRPGLLKKMTRLGLR